MRRLYYIVISIVIAGVIGSIAVFESFSSELEKDNGKSQQQLNENKLNSPSNLQENSSKGMDTDQGDWQLLLLLWWSKLNRWWLLILINIVID